MRRLTLPRCCWVLLASGCATVDPGPDYAEARRQIEATTGLADVHDPRGPLLSAEEIDLLLVDGLGLEEATRLALLNNRRLQAGFLALGVARADFVQAGLLENPSLSLAFLIPDAGGRVRWTADLVGSVAEIWQLPARQALARAGLEQRILALSRFAGELVSDTRRAYLEGVAARAAAGVARENVALTQRSLAAVQRQVEEGVATRTEAMLAEGEALRAELALQRAGRAEVASLRRLAALLSLEQDLLAVTLTDPLPDPVAPTVEREALVRTSLAARADLRASARAVAAAEERLALERRRRLDLGLGLSAERPEGGGSTDFLLGPGAVVELPLFDQNQVQVSRAELELAGLRKEHEARVLEALQEVRAALDAATVAARAAAFARSELVPQAESAAALAERAHALGDTTVLTLLQAQAGALEARRVALEARLEAALAQVDLERAAGAPLPYP